MAILIMLESPILEEHNSTESSQTLQIEGSAFHLTLGRGKKYTAEIIATITSCQQSSVYVIQCYLWGHLAISHKQG